MYKRTDDKNDKNDESQRRLKTLFNFIFLVQTVPLAKVHYSVLGV